MKHVGTFLLAGAVAGVGVWFFNTPTGKKLLDETIKSISDAVSGALKSTIGDTKSKVDDLADESVEYIDDANKIIQKA